MSGIKVGIIGCGNMGGAIAEGMINSGNFSSDDILLNDKDIDKAACLAEKTGCSVEGISVVACASKFLLIAVKPQDFEELSEEITKNISNQTIISIMAGVKIDTITNKLGKTPPVVRAMPNMAAFVSEGVTCISSSDTARITEDIKSIFTGIGRVVEVDEKFMDGVTALSGSGPAYLFYLAEAMIQAGKELGLDDDIAKELVIQTMYGSAALMRNAEISPEELIKKVASKGGTTEAALKVFDEKNMKSIIKTAVMQAKNRSEEMSGG